MHPGRRRQRVSDLLEPRREQLFSRRDGQDERYVAVNVTGRRPGVREPAACPEGHLALGHHGSHTLERQEPAGDRAIDRDGLRVRREELLAGRGMSHGATICLAAPRVRVTSTMRRHLPSVHRRRHARAYAGRVGERSPPRRRVRRRITSSATARLMIHAAPIRTVRDSSCADPKTIAPGMSTMAWVPAPIPIA